MRLYTVDGYADMRNILDVKSPFIVVIGGRGTGKTYGALSEMLRREEKFILMRRTQTQCDMISKPEFSPFKAIDPLICCAPVAKNITGFYHGEKTEDGTIKPIGAVIGYALALTTISNTRGFDASDVTYLIYDEFIPEKHDRPIKHEGEAFLNAYETINRNRELKGQKPLKCVLLANANNPGNAILDALGLVDIVDTMTKRHKTQYTTKNGLVTVIMLTDSPISNMKRNTVLYRLANSGDFADMSLSNEFSRGNYEHIQAGVNLKEYRPILQFEDICIYEHKSDYKYYVTRYKTGSPPKYENLPTQLEQVKRALAYVGISYERGRVKFADFYSKSKFLSIWD